MKNFQNRRRGEEIHRYFWASKQNKFLFFCGFFGLILCNTIGSKKVFCNFWIFFVYFKYFWAHKSSSLGFCDFVGFTLYRIAPPNGDRLARNFEAKIFFGTLVDSRRSKLHTCSAFWFKHWLPFICFTGKIPLAIGWDYQANLASKCNV